MKPARIYPLGGPKASTDPLGIEPAIEDAERREAVLIFQRQTIADAFAAALAPIDDELAAVREELIGYREARRKQHEADVALRKGRAA